MTLSYSKACLIGTILESMAYGFYLSLFMHSMQIFQRKREIGQLSWRLACTNVVLWILVTIHMILDNMAVVEAFTEDTATPDAADEYYTLVDRETLFRVSAYVVLTLFADLFMVYRVWVVWRNKVLYLIMIAPFLLALGDIVMGGFFLAAVSSLVETQGYVSTSPWEHRKLIFYAITLVLNLLCTILIALRVWTMQRSVIAGLSPSFTRVRASLAIIVESAALYTTALIAIIVPTAMGRLEQYVILNLLPGIIGISFSLIIIRTSHEHIPLPRTPQRDGEKTTVHLGVSTVMGSSEYETVDETSWR